MGCVTKVTDKLHEALLSVWPLVFPPVLWQDRASPGRSHLQELPLASGQALGSRDGPGGTLSQAPQPPGLGLCLSPCGAPVWVAFGTVLGGFVFRSFVIPPPQGLPASHQKSGERAERSRLTHSPLLRPQTGGSEKAPCLPASWVAGGARGGGGGRGGGRGGGGGGASPGRSGAAWPCSSLLVLCPVWAFSREARPSLQPRADRHLFLDLQVLRGLTEPPGRLAGGPGVLVDVPL